MKVTETAIILRLKIKLFISTICVSDNQTYEPLVWFVMIKAIDHIGVAVKDLKETIKFFKKLGLEPANKVELQNAKFAFIPVGQGEIELIEPTNPEHSIAKFIEDKGEGIHHIGLEVKEIDQALEKLRENKIKLIDEKPRIGAHGVKIAFIDPKSARRILIELCESQK